MSDGRHRKPLATLEPGVVVADLQDPGSLSMLAYLVGRLANEPVTDNADVVGELLAMEIVAHRLVLMAR